MQKKVIIDEIGTVCKICGKEFDSTTMLSMHIKREHNIQRHEYYEKYINPDVDIYCPYCGEEKRVVNNWYREKTCGSEECRSRQNSDRNKAKWSQPEYKESQRLRYREYWNSDIGRKMAKTHAKERYLNHPDTAMSGVNAMHKAMFIDSVNDLDKFKSLRTKYEILM